MNKLEYLNTLKRELRTIPETEQGEIMSDYEEHFRVGLERGESEEAISKALGDVRATARQFKADYSIKLAESTISARYIAKAVLATISLGLFNLIFVLGLFLGLAGVLIGIFATAIALIVGGISTLVALIIAPFFPGVVVSLAPAFAIFGAIGITTAGLLLFIASCYLAGAFYRATVKYLKWNVEIVRNNNKEEK
jgi:uncharacterized membrane protein